MANVVLNRDLHRVVATAIVYRPSGSGFEFLILKRSPNQKAFPNLWTVPGGGLELDDYVNTPKTTADTWYHVVEQMLQREVFEETSLKVGDFRYLCSMTFIRPDGVPVVVLSYYAPYQSGEVQLDKDHTEHVWVTLEQAKNYELIEGIWDELRDVEQLLSTTQA